jgi:acyl-coenzyme A thioesterase PaaI-like protein
LEREKSRSVIAELGLLIQPDGDDLVSQATISEGMKIPGTDALRLSVVAAWADTVLGIQAMKDILPSVPATVELDVHLIRPIIGTGRIISRARVAKIGKTISEFVMDFNDESGTLLGHGHGLFMATPNPQFSLPPGDWVFKGFAKPWPGLALPLAERIGCVRTSPGVATLPWAKDTQNATKAINGGLLAVPIEEAVLSAALPGQSLSSMTITYQRSIRTGPAIARAQVSECLGRVEVIDASNDKLAALASVQLFKV